MFEKFLLNIHQSKVILLNTILVKKVYNASYKHHSFKKHDEVKLSILYVTSML